jgi:hypothetical protein
LENKSFRLATVTTHDVTSGIPELLLHKLRDLLINVHVMQQTEEPTGQTYTVVSTAVFGEHENAV